MAAITFNATHQKVHIQEWLKTVRRASRQMLDAFVSNQLRRAAAEHIRPRRPGTQPQSIKAQ